MNFKIILIFILFLYSCETKNINISDRDIISPSTSFSNRGFALIFDKGLKKKRAEKLDIPSDYLKSLSDDLHKLLGTQVRINPSKTLSNGKKIKGSLEIIYHNPCQL